MKRLITLLALCSIILLPTCLTNCAYGSDSSPEVMSHTASYSGTLIHTDDAGRMMGVTRIGNPVQKRSTMLNP